MLDNHQFHQPNNNLHTFHNLDIPVFAMGLKDVVVSAYGSNLFVWTAKSNTFVDPELTSFGNDLEGNFGEYSANPSSRHFGFNLKFNF